MKRIGRYEIIDQLGHGSMAVIYRAKDTTLDREIALKTLSIEGLRDPELLERFYREARSCAKLRHPNIVTVFDFGKQEDLAYIAMELLEGSDLRRIIADRTSMSPERKLDIMAGVCSALAHAHANGIVHRDIKPSNIFVESNGQPRLLDFGIAYIPASSLTVVGRSLGTPRYMSPEQLEGHSCDARSDIFSTAVVIYEFLSGQHPFGGFPGKPLSHGPSLLDVLPGCPPDLDATLQRALAPKPQLRLSSAAELASVLREARAKIDRGCSLEEPLPPQESAGRSAGTETILSAVLVNLQRFDEAADCGDLAAARSALAAMQSVGAQDSRYAVALEQAAKRLTEIESAPGAGAHEERPSRDLTVPVNLLVKPSTPEPRERNATASRLDIAAPTLIGQTVFLKKHEEPSVPLPHPVDPSSVPLLGAVTGLPVERRRARSRIGGLLLFAMLVSGLAGAGLYLYKTHFSTPPHSMPAVALATVLPAEAFLFLSPDSSRSPIASVHHGDSLNVLRPPRYREQQWTEVQQVSATHVSSIVFIRTANLGNWSSSDPAVEQHLQELFDPQAKQ